MTWSAVQRELRRLAADIGDPIDGPEPPELVAAVAREAAELCDGGHPPPDRVVPSNCGKGPVLVWDTASTLDAGRAGRREAGPRAEAARVTAPAGGRSPRPPRPPSGRHLSFFSRFPSMSNSRFSPPTSTAPFPLSLSPSTFSL